MAVTNMRRCAEMAQVTYSCFFEKRRRRAACSLGVLGRMPSPLSEVVSLKERMHLPKVSFVSA